MKKTSVKNRTQSKPSRSKLKSRSEIDTKVRSSHKESSPESNPAPEPVSDPEGQLSCKPKADSPYSDHVSPGVWNKTQEADLRIAAFEVALIVWNEHFSERERERLGGDVHKAWNRSGGTVAMYMQARGVDQIDAIIQVAYLAGFLREVDRDNLQRAWGLPVGHISGLQRPIWHPKLGKLFFEKQLIRTFRLYNAGPSKLWVLIDKFDAEEWPESIESPFTTPEQLRDTLRELNKRLKRIRFHALSKGTMCRWDVVDS